MTASVPANESKRYRDFGLLDDSLRKILLKQICKQIECYELQITDANRVDRSDMDKHCGGRRGDDCDGAFLFQNYVHS